MRLYYCDASLVSNIGHFATNCRSILKAYRSLGVDARVLANRKIEPDLADELGASQFFSMSAYARTSKDPLSWWLKSFIDMSRVFRSDFEKLQDVGRDDLIYYDTATPAVIMGVLEWIQSTFAPDQCPTVVLATEEHVAASVKKSPDGGSRLVSRGHEPALYRYAGSCLDAGYARRVFWVCYPWTLAEVYTKVLEKEVRPLPHPVVATTSCRDRRGGSNRTLGFLGAQRPGKGFQLVPEIVKLLLKRQSDVHIVIQNAWEVMSSEMTQLRQLEAGDARVEVFDGAMDEAEWAELLDRCDLLVAPYDKNLYAHGGSGILFEALANAIPMVAPEGTSMELILREYGLPGALIGEVTPGKTIESIEAALANYDELAVRASRASEQWARENGPLNTARAILALAK